MKSKKNLILIFWLISISLISQNNSNIISGKIKVPLIVDEINMEDHFLDDRRDSNVKKTDVKFDIYTQLKNIPIQLFQQGKSFKGVFYEKQYDLITKLEISGKINPDKNLGSITVMQKQTKNTKSGVCNYSYEYSYVYNYKNLNVRKQLPIGSKQQNKTTMFFFSPNKDTELTLGNFKYIEDTKCQKRNYSKEIIKKRINQTYLNEKLLSNWAYFRFNVNWDGRTLENDITVTKVRNEDPNWEPPSTPYLVEGIETEPNSIAIYPTQIKIINVNNAEIQYNYKPLEKGFPALLLADLSKVPNLKVLERQKIAKILQEIELSESGLVTEDSKVKNNLMKEAMAVIVKLEIDTDTKTFNTKCSVQSKNSEIIISSANLPLKELFGIQKHITELIIEEVNTQFHMNIDPKIIFSQ